MNDVYFTREHRTTTTPLFNVEPRGVGTGQIQSLLDYLKTLALAHRLSLNAILELLLNLVGKGQARGQARMFDGRRCQGPTDVAKVLVDAAERATGRDDLLFTTMLPFAAHLSSSFLITAPRYCPACFAGCSEESLPYTRLLWCLYPVQCCPIHRLKLVQPVCGAQSKYERPRTITDGVCSSCGAIGHHCNNAVPEIASATDLWVASQVADMLSHAQELSTTKPEAAKSFLRAYCQRPGNSLHKVSLRAGVDFKVVHRYLNRPDHTVELNTFLKIAASEGLWLVGLLKGTGEQCDVSPGRVHGQERTCVRNRDWTAIAAKADEALNAGHGLGSWARELGIHPSSLAYNLPEEAARLVAATRARSEGRRGQFMKKLVLECETIADGRWAQKRSVAPVGTHEGKRLNGERPALLRSLGWLLDGSYGGGLWSADVEQELIEAARRIAVRNGTTPP